MSRGATDHFLERTAFAHFATVSPNGDPYEMPNLFVYADGKIFSHTRLAGHFRSNIGARPRQRRRRERRKARDRKVSGRNGRSSSARDLRPVYCALTTDSVPLCLERPR